LPNIEWLTTLSPGGWDYEGFCSGFGHTPGYSLEAFLDGCYLPSKYSKGIAWIQQESTFWRRSLWDKVGGYVRTDINLASDFDLWCRFYNYAALYGTFSPLGGFRTQCYQKSRSIEEYMKEAEESLSAMRHSFQWRHDFWQDILFSTKVKRIPKIKKFVVSKWGYKGKRVIREKSDQPNASWKIEDYKF
jgi:hypothetical protein